MKQVFKMIGAIICLLIVVIAFTIFASIYKHKSVVVPNSSSSQEVSSVPQLESSSSIEVLEPEEVVEEKTTELLAQAKQENADTVAWLNVAGTTINNSVLQSSDNSYYLRRNEKKEDDIWGCYFADLFANLTSANNLTQNTVIYGHSATNENPESDRFSALYKFMDINFLKENSLIQLTLNDEVVNFEIFAVFFTNVDFYYISPTPSEQGFEGFKQSIEHKNQYIFDNGDITENDKLLTLSTCSSRYDVADTNNYRFVVMAKKVDESAIGTVKVVSKNSSPELP